MIHYAYSMKKYLLTFLFVFLLMKGETVFAQSGALSDAQSSWVKSVQSTFIVRPERGNAPYSFVSSAGRTPQGIGIDYITLVAKKVGATIQYTDPKARSALLEDIRDGKTGILVSVGYSQKNEEYLYFSDPYLFVPAVIVVRKDTPFQKRYTTLASLEGRRVAVAEDYSIEYYLKENYEKIILDSVMDNEVALQKVLLGEVDAAVVDIASLAYYTKNNALSYLTTVGQTGYDVELSFAVPKSQPELQSVLNAGLLRITEDEKEQLREKWLTYATESSEVSQTWKSQNTILIFSIAGLLLAVFIFIIVHLIHEHKARGGKVKRMDFLSSAAPVETLRKQLQDIEDANNLVSKEIQEIKEFEERLQKRGEGL